MVYPFEKHLKFCQQKMFEADKEFRAGNVKGVDALLVAQISFDGIKGAEENVKRLLEFVRAYQKTLRLVSIALHDGDMERAEREMSACLGILRSLVRER